MVAHTPTPAEPTREYRRFEDLPPGVIEHACRVLVEIVLGLMDDHPELFADLEPEADCEEVAS